LDRRYDAAAAHVRAAARRSGRRRGPFRRSAAVPRRRRSQGDRPPGPEQGAAHAVAGTARPPGIGAKICQSRAKRGREPPMSMNETITAESPAAAGGEASPKRVFVKTYGCQMNVYDSQRMADALAADGYVATDAIED